MSWGPSARSRLLCRQLGFSSANIQQALNQYLQQAGTHDEAGFMAYMARQLEQTGEGRAYAEQLAAIPVCWQPSEQVCQGLIAQGFSREQLFDFRDEFIMECRERNYRAYSEDALFSRYCIKRLANEHRAGL